MSSALEKTYPRYELFGMGDVHSLIPPPGDPAFELGELLISERVLQEARFDQIAPLVLAHQRRETVAMTVSEVRELRALEPYGFHFSVHETDDPHCRLWFTTEPLDCSDYRTTTVELAA